MTDRPSTVTFKAQKDEKEVEFMVRLPNLDQQREGQKQYNRAFSDAVKSGALLRTKLDDFMEEQKIWNEDKQREVEALSRDIMHKEQVLAKGGIKLSDAKTVALDLRKLREDMRELIAKKMELDVHTAEGQADNARFNYWVSVCLVYNSTQKPVFSSVDEYLNNSTEEYAAQAASKLAELLYNLNSDFEMSLEENSFLKEFGFINEEGQFINNDGQLVNEDGDRIDDQGYLINEDGTRIDVEGNPLDEDGNYKFDRQPFLDDDGQPVNPKKTEPVQETEPIPPKPEPEPESEPEPAET